MQLNFAGVGQGYWLDYEPMKVFLSWSKEPSKSIATFLHSWLKDVIQSLEPWMSAEDIPVGDRWANQISGELEKRNFGILVLTPENQFQPWINYEAGALSKLVGSSRVIPYTFGFKPADVSSPPLTAFQGVEATKEGTLLMLKELNKALAAPLTETQLERAFDKNWSDLDNKLQEITEEQKKRQIDNPSSTPAPRSDSDKLDEVLVLLRNLNSNSSERAIRNLESRYGIETIKAANKNNRIVRGSIEDIVIGLRAMGLNAIPLEVIAGEVTTYKIGIISSEGSFSKIKRIAKNLFEEDLPQGTKVEFVNVENIDLPFPK